MFRGALIGTARKMVREAIRGPLAAAARDKILRAAPPPPPPLAATGYQMLRTFFGFAKDALFKSDKPGCYPAVSGKEQDVKALERVAGSEPSPKKSEIGKDINIADLSDDEIAKLVTEEYPELTSPYTGMFTVAADEEIYSSLVGHPKSKDEEVYLVLSSSDEVKSNDRESLFKDMMQEADCASGFIGCSQFVPNRFFAKLDEKKAAKLQGVKGISALYPACEHVVHY